MKASNGNLAAVRTIGVLPSLATRTIEAFPLSIVRYKNAIHWLNYSGWLKVYHILNKSNSQWKKADAGLNRVKAKQF